MQKSEKQNMYTADVLDILKTKLYIVDVLNTNNQKSLQKIILSLVKINR